jgi:hypothetical protein
MNVVWVHRKEVRPFYLGFDYLGGQDISDLVGTICSGIRIPC